MERLSNTLILLLLICSSPIGCNEGTPRKPSSLTVPHALTYHPLPDETLHHFIQLSFHLKSKDGLPILIGLTTNQARQDLENMSEDDFDRYFKERELEYMDFTVTDILKVSPSTLLIEYRLGFWDLTPGSSEVEFLNRNRAELTLTHEGWKVSDIQFLSQNAKFLRGPKIRVMP